MYNVHFVFDNDHVSAKWKTISQCRHRKYYIASGVKKITTNMYIDQVQLID